MMSISLTALFNKKPVYLAVAAGFFLLNFVLKIFFISSRDIAMDEPFTIFFAQMDTGEIFSMLKTENNPPLHFLIMHFWIKLFGIDPFSVRFLSVVFSSFTATIIFLTGRKFFSVQAALLAASIYTLSVMNIYFSHEARVYALFVMLSSLSLYFFLSLIKSPDKKSTLFLLFIINLLIIYSHYFGFFIIITQAVSLIFSGSFKKLWKKMLLLYAMLIISYLPIILIFIKRLSISVSQGTWVKPPQFTELYGNLNRFLNSKYPLALLALISLIYFILWAREKSIATRIKSAINNKYLLILLLWFGIPYCGMFISSFVAPMFLDRYLLFTSVFFFLLIAVFISLFCRKQWIVYLSAMLFLIAMTVNLSLNPDNHRNVKGLIAQIQQLKKPGSIVIISPEYAFREFTYHYNKDYFADYNNTMTLLNNENIFPLRNTDGFSTDELLQATSVIYIDCGSSFAFGNDAVYSSLKNLLAEKQQIKAGDAYTIYEFESVK